MRLLKWTGLFLLALYLTGAALAQSPTQPQTPAGSRLDHILTRGILRVGLTGDYRPFSALDKPTGTYSGLDVDMAMALAAELGVKLEIVATKWSDLINDVNGDKFDVGMGGISVNLTRQKLALFSVPLMQTGKTPIVRCTDRGKYQTLATIDRPNVKVIVNPGGTNEKFDRANLTRAQIVLFPDNTKIFEEIIDKRADVMITDAVEARLQQKLHRELCALHPDKPFDFGELAYLLPRDFVWKAYVDQFVHLTQANGAYAKLTAKWLE